MSLADWTSSRPHVLVLVDRFVMRITCQDVRGSQIAASDLGARGYFYMPRGTNTPIELIFLK
jgi:hypothetical protein